MQELFKSNVMEFQTIFSSRRCTVKALHLGFSCILVNFYVWVQLYSLDVDILFSQHHLWKRISFFNGYSWHPFQKSHDYIPEGLFLTCWSVFLIYMSVDNCSFVIHFKLRRCESSNFVLLFKEIWAIRGSLRLPVSFTIFFSSF
jgi:hypothetical protein